MEMFKEITGTLKVEVRPNSEEDYLEAVVSRPELESLVGILTKHLGPAAKEPGKQAQLSGDVKRLVDLLGGLRSDQSFFCKDTGAGKINYAALWPWQSNPDRITIKAGAYEIPPKRKLPWQR